VRDAVLTQLGRLRRRYRWVRGADVFLEAWFVLSLAAASLFMIDRLAFEFGLAAPHVTTPAPVIAGFAAALVLALIGAGVVMVRRVSPSSLAWRVDKAIGSHERLLTSVELACDGAGSVFAPALFQQAAADMEKADATRVFPAAPVGYRGGIALALMAGGFVIAFPPVLAPAPIADFSVDVRRGAAPLDIVADDASIGIIERREWDFGDGMIAEAKVISHRYAKPGRYTISLTVRGPGGVDVEKKKNFIEVLDARSPVAEFAAQPVRGRAPLQVYFANQSSNAAAFEWDFGDKTRSGTAEPSHVYSEPGVYSVTLTAINAFGRDVVAKRNFIKVAGPDAPLADFRANPRKGTAMLGVQFEDQTDGKATEWEWDFGDVSLPSENSSRDRNPHHVYRFPGKYTVRLRVKGPGGEDEAVKERYIEVESEGDSGGGKGPNAADQNSEPKSGSKQGNPKGAGDTPGKDPFGAKTDRPDVKLEPASVKPHTTDGPLFPKEKPVFDPGGAGGTGDSKYAPAYEKYQRAAEDAMEREQIPPSLRTYVKQYFEAIRPK